MIRRFHIEDLVAQDSSGVVFRALDTETGKWVALRRFFPFGAAGGGLQADEQAAYGIAVERLAALRHPALRSIICGACDPIDGMPFIATEWIDGRSIQSFIEQGPLSAEMAARLLAQALDVCELLSRMFGEEAVWVETGLSAIIVGSGQSGRQITFWIAPLKWLSPMGTSRGLGAMVTLTEEIMGWQGRRITDQAGAGLGGWLKWLRRAAARTSLQEAGGKLAAAMGAAAPAPLHHVVARVPRPLARKVQTSSSGKALWVINSLLALVAAGLGGWLWLRQQTEPTSLSLPPPAPRVLSNLAAEPVKTSAAELVGGQAGEPLALSQLANEKTQVALTAQKYAARDSGGVIPWNRRELLLLNDDKQVVVEGVLAKIDFSSTRKSLYLLFSQHPDKNDARGVVLVKSAAAGLSEAELTPLIGRKIRLHGTLELQTRFGLQRPDIPIKDRAAVEVIE